MMKELLKKLNQIGVKISLLDNGKLDIQAPKGVITKDLLDEIKLYKDELIDFFTLYKQNRQQTIIPITEKKEDYVLSSSQRRLWLLSQLEGGSRAYNMPSVFEIEGNLDVSCLEDAFKSLIMRHESLRTVFNETESGEVKQVVLELEDVKFELQYEDLNKGGISEDFIKKRLVKSKNKQNG